MKATSIGNLLDKTFKGY